MGEFIRVEKQKQTNGKCLTFQLQRKISNITWIQTFDTKEHKLLQASFKPSYCIGLLTVSAAFDIAK